MKSDIQTVEAVYESDAFRPLTPLLGLKEHARVLLQVRPVENAKSGKEGLASLSGGWEGSDGLALAVESVFRSRSPGRSLVTGNVAHFERIPGLNICRVLSNAKTGRQSPEGGARPD